MWERANRDEAIEIAVRIGGHDAESIPDSYEHFLNNGLVRYGTLSREGFNQVGELLIEGGVIESYAGMEKYADPGYQKLAREQLSSPRR